MDTADGAGREVRGQVSGVGMRGCSFWPSLKGAQTESCGTTEGKASGLGHTASLGSRQGAGPQVLLSWGTFRLQTPTAPAIPGEAQPHQLKTDALGPFSGLAPGGLDEMLIHSLLEVTVY